MREILLLVGIGCGAPAPLPVQGEDVDGDGAIAGYDCDDGDPDRFPGAPERCNGIDDDCNERVDDAPVDGRTWYADADRDGYGTPASWRVACTAPEGHVANADDCDDGSAEATPARATDPCDGIDNDCSGAVDDGVGYTPVPAAHPTVQAAIDDGASVVCLARGAWGAPFAVHDRNVTVLGGGAEGQVLLDFDLAAEPLATVTGAHGRLVLENLTVVNLRVLAAEVSGQLATVVGGELVLDRVVIVDSRAVALHAGSLEGVLIRAEGATVTLTDVVVRDLTLAHQPLESAGQGSLTVRGGLLHAVDSDVSLRRVVVDDVDIETEAYLGDGAVPTVVEGGVVWLRGGTLSADSLDLDAGRVDVHGVSSHVRGGLVYAEGTDLEGTRLAFTRARLTAVGDPALVEGLVYLAGVRGTLDDVTLTANELTATSGRGDAEATGALTVVDSPGLAITHLTATGQQVTADDLGGRAAGLAQGGAVHIVGGGRLQWVDLRANEVVGDVRAEGGALYVGGGVEVSHAVVAANVAGRNSRTDAAGGGVFVGPGVGPVSLVHVDLVRNVAIADRAAGGGLAFEGGVGASLVVLNSNLVGNEVRGDEVRGAAAAVGPGGTVDWTYTNTWSTVGGAFAGLADPTGVAGNLAVDPAYVDVATEDPLAWDLRLRPASPVRGRGAPAEGAPEELAPDLGAYGGTNGVGW